MCVSETFMRVIMTYNFVLSTLSLEGPSGLKATSHQDQHCCMSFNCVFKD